ncbi:MAG: DUF1572 domain-containing protein [Flavobacteriaceae bacterium]|nr:DUF1572 domain-containing protein [Bacteroidia bacterium]NNF75276.1 DUF1572 domain-containing protein [Flavobacteriaceae bacterium]NNK86753.1 DUF1572 domain-containing protein [Flavobacteriaceae bacterium]
MENTHQIANRFREVILDGKWIANTNYRKQLSDLSWQQATAKIGSLNTIAVLAFHINYYIAGVLNVFEGGDLEIRDKFSFDMPEINSKAEWDMLLNDMWSNAERFANLIERMPNHKLDDVFVKKEYGNYRRNIQGIIEHSYYHLGQISLIKKLILESEKES